MFFDNLALLSVLIFSHIGQIVQQLVLPAQILTEPAAELMKHVRHVKIVEMPSGWSDFVSVH